jgi:hypothetical protein
MLQIKSFTTGEILGIAKDEGIARAMALTNGWRNWVAEPLEGRLELLEPEPDTDPRNMRGRKIGV